MSFDLEFEKNIHEPWRNEYVTYFSIHEGLYNLHKNWTSKDEKDFESAIRLEANKVDQFINRKQREIETRIGHCQRSRAQDMARKLTKDEANNILSDVHELSRYIRTNFLALENLIKEHDHLTHHNRHALFVEICRTHSLDCQRLDPILIKSSSLIDCYQTSSNSAINARYWVHQDYITELKSTLLFNLPMFNGETRIEFENTERLKTLVYFDNNNFSQYTSRLQCDDGAEIFDCKWNDSFNLASKVTFERRSYNKSSVGYQSAFETKEIDKSLVYDFVSGHQYLSGTIQNYILKNKLKPTLRVDFYRLLYKSPNNKSLSISLDTNIKFRKATQDTWWFTQDLNGVINSENLSSFPYALLEINIQNGDIPIWLSNLLQSRLILEVPRFSTYLHGMAVFYHPQLALLPWWLSIMNEDIFKSNRHSTFLTSEDSVSRRSSVLNPLSDTQNRMGYLNTQLGKTKCTKKDSIYEARRISFGSNHDAVSLDSKDTIRPSEDSKTREINEDTPSNYYRTDHNTLQLRKPSMRQTKDANFIDFYDEGRNKKSEGYMLHNVNTITNEDQLRKDVDEQKKDKNKKKNKKIKPPSHTIEPKQYFANERTFINWLQFAALLMSSGLTLMNFGDRISTICGIVFFGISVIIALYAFFRNRFRAHQMNTRPDIRYDDIYGPVGLCILLVAAMVLNTVLRWEHPPATDTYLGIDEQTNAQNTTQSI